MPATASSPASFEQSHRLAIGKVTSRPRKQYPRFKGLANFLADHLKDFGVDGVDVIFAKDNEEMFKLIEEGRIDFISETMFSTMLYVRKTGLEILLREWRNNVPEYHTVFFTRRDSPITNLADLDGKLLAFEDPGSTTAYFLPRTVLKRHKMKLRKVDWPSHTLNEGPEGVVRYVFAGTEYNIPIWVQEGRVHAGVLSNTDWLDPELVPDVLKKELRIFLETESVPRSLLSVRHEVPDDIKKRVRQVLLTVDGSTEAKYVFEKVAEITRYDEVPAVEVDRFMALFQDLWDETQQ